MDTRMLIGDALEYLLQGDTHIDSLAASAIIKQAGVSKQTFYNHFKDKYDVLEYQYCRISEPTFGRVGEEGYTWTQFMRERLAFMREKDAFYRNSRSLENPNGLREIDHRLQKEAYLTYLAHRGADITDEGVLFSADLFVRGALSKVDVWRKSGKPIPEDDLIELYRQALPQNIAHYFQ